MIWTIQWWNKPREHRGKHWTPTGRSTPGVGVSSPGENQLQSSVRHYHGNFPLSTAYSPSPFSLSLSLFSLSFLSLFSLFFSLYLLLSLGAMTTLLFLSWLALAAHSHLDQAGNNRSLGKLPTIIGECCLLSSLLWFACCLRRLPRISPNPMCSSHHQVNHLLNRHFSLSLSLFF